MDQMASTSVAVQHMSGHSSRQLLLTTKDLECKALSLSTKKWGLGTSQRPLGFNISGIWIHFGRVLPTAPSHRPPLSGKAHHICPPAHGTVFLFTKNDRKTNKTNKTKKKQYSKNNRISKNTDMFLSASICSPRDPKGR